MAKLTHIAVAVVERGDQFLVGRRPDNVPLAGFAEFPGGKVKSAEKAADAATRECLEETGVAVEVIEQISRVQHEYDHGTLLLHFFACRVLEDAAEPLGTFRWVPREELAMLEFPPANLEVVVRLTGVN